MCANETYSADVGLTQSSAVPASDCSEPAVLRAIDRLSSAFRVPMALVDVDRGELARVPIDCLNVDIGARLALCAEVARRGRPEFIEDHAPIAVLAVPLPTAVGVTTQWVAIASLATCERASSADIQAAARLLGVDAEQANQWYRRQAVWHPHAAQELAIATVDCLQAGFRETTLRRQLSSSSRDLLHAIEELHLLHRLASELRLARSEFELSSLALRWLAGVLPAEAIVCRTLPLVGHTGEIGSGHLLIEGDFEIDEEEFGRLVERLGPQCGQRSVVLDSTQTASPTWYYPKIQQLASVPIRDGEATRGWLVAINYVSRPGELECEFGALEVSLLESVASLLSVHAGNHRLLRQQSGFVADCVRALSSAIDAKDSYTRGHSERVARVAVRLAEQIGCSDEDIQTLYLGGLLHDVGKIGLDDTVLRKPGQLTPDEFEQVKRHPELGCRILDGVGQLQHVLPIVRHHHEAWDGSGYPEGLVGDDTPLLARVTAVADAYDAMSSDRPYRPGMPAERIEAILERGAGQQWDPLVVAAYFAARDDIESIVHNANQQLAIDGQAQRV